MAKNVPRENSSGAGQHFDGSNTMTEGDLRTQEIDWPDSMPRRDAVKLGVAGILTLLAGVAVSTREKLGRFMGSWMNEPDSDLKTDTTTGQPFSIPMPSGYTCTSSCAITEMEGFSKKVGNLTKDEGGKKLRIVFEYTTKLTVPGNDANTRIHAEFVQSVHNGNVSPFKWYLTKTEGNNKTIAGEALSEQELESLLRGIDLATAQLPNAQTAEEALGAWSEDRHPFFSAFVLSEGKKQLTDNSRPPDPE